MKRKEIRGFTLIELVVVMVIIGILAVVSVPMYRNYVQRARAQEGVALVGGIASAERVYFAEFGRYWPVSSTGSDPVLGMDTGKNSYFQAYAVVSVDPWETFTAQAFASDEGITVTLFQDTTGGPDLSISGI